MNSPPIVGENVENAQHHNKECGRPLGLETNGNHDTSGKTNDRNKNAHEAPFALKNEAKEKEDQEDSAGKEEVFPAVVLTKGWQAREDRFTGDHGIAENHEETTNNTQVAEEEVQVKDETITESLDNNNTEKTSNSVLRKSLQNNSGRAR